MEHLGQGRRRRLTAVGTDRLGIRAAGQDDLPGLRRFAREVLPEHYAPIIGTSAAEDQVTQWWTDERHAAAIGQGTLLVAEDAGEIVGVVQWGPFDGEQVIWKLYLRPAHRGSGLGTRLLDATIARLPADAGRLLIEHFAGNTGAARFYEREGFRVQRVELHPGDDRALDTVWRVREF